MGIHIVEVEDGRRRVRPLGAFVLFALLFTTCMLLPATFFWLTLRDAFLVRTSLGMGMYMTCLMFGMMLFSALRLPLGRLPHAPSSKPKGPDSEILGLRDA